MPARSAGPAMLFLVTVLAAAGVAPGASAQDFFSNLFGGFGFRPPAPPPMDRPLVDPLPATEMPRARAGYGGGQA